MRNEISTTCYSRSIVYLMKLDIYIQTLEHKYIQAYQLRDQKNAFISRRRHRQHGMSYHLYDMIYPRGKRKKDGYEVLKRYIRNTCASQMQYGIDI